MSRRVERVEKELRQVVANYLLTGFKYSMEGLISVSRVQASPDLRSARIFITIMGNDEGREECIETLQSHAVDVQREVSKKLQMKFCPKLRFLIDNSIDQALKIDGILHEIQQEQKQQQEDSSTESLSSEEE